MLKSIFLLFAIIYLIGATCAVVVFIVDVFRWHPREEKVTVVPSNTPVFDEESEVTEDDGYVGEHHTSIVLGAGRES